MLKFFSGLTNKETAQTLGISEANVERRWAFAKVCLFQMMGEQKNDDLSVVERENSRLASGSTPLHSSAFQNQAFATGDYLSLFGDDFKDGGGRRTQMRMVIGESGSDPEKHQNLYQTFRNEVESKPRTFHINPEIKQEKLRNSRCLPPEQTYSSSCDLPALRIAFLSPSADPVRANNPMAWW